MKRGQITTLAELKTGDRFYRLGDGKKVSLHFAGESKVLNQFDYSNATAVKNGFTVTNQIRQGKGNLRVVYLRNVNDPT